MSGRRGFVGTVPKFCLKTASLFAHNLRSQLRR